MEEHEELSYNGIEALRVLKNLGLKLGKTKVYADIRDGVLSCTTDKRVLHSELLAYAEALKPKDTGGLSEIERLRKGQRLLLNLVKELFPSFAQMPAGSKLEKWLKEIEELLPDAGIDLVRSAIEKARMEVPKTTERALDARRFRNTLLLQGIALGIVAKGRVNRKDALLVARWISDHPTLWEEEGINVLLQESNHLSLVSARDFNETACLLYQKLCEFLRSNRLTVPKIRLEVAPQKKDNVCTIIPKYDPLFDHVEEIEFSASFCFTGTFAFGTREQCEEAAMQHGGWVLTQPAKTSLCYLVVGTATNPQWKEATRGVKLMKAIEYRKEGCPICIIHEDVWAEAIVAASTNTPTHDRG